MLKEKNWLVHIFAIGSPAMEIFRANIWEIKKAGSLRSLGGLLALFHIFLFTYWVKQGDLPEVRENDYWVSGNTIR